MSIRQLNSFWKSSFFKIILFLVGITSSFSSNKSQFIFLHPPNIVLTSPPISWVSTCTAIGATYAPKNPPSCFLFFPPDFQISFIMHCFLILQANILASLSSIFYTLKLNHFCLKYISIRQSNIPILAASFS